ncbi:MAG: hypothetical protein ACP5TH_06540 [Fervidicoccaceae archaeon]
MKSSTSPMTTASSVYRILCSPTPEREKRVQDPIPSQDEHPAI